ncbi:MAG: type IV pili methyl-accepting chemotaxis transducer N-terminal domain-containing protein [Pseudomonadota bacterium]
MRSDTALTIRCISAFGILGLVMIASYVFVSQAIDQSSKNAALINTAGMQRMLSQRIALNALRATTTDDVDNHPSVDQLRTAIMTMRGNHDTLLRQTFAKRFQQRYPAAVLKEHVLNEKVEDFLAAGNTLLSSLSGGGSDGRLSAEGEMLQNHLAAGLLGDLDTYVMTLQKIDETETARFIRLQAICLVVGLVTLVAAGVFVFIPITNGISRALDRLDAADSELRQFSYSVSND